MGRGKGQELQSAMDLFRSTFPICGQMPNQQRDNRALALEAVDHKSRGCPSFKTDLTLGAGLPLHVGGLSTYELRCTQYLPCPPNWALIMPNSPLVHPDLGTDMAPQGPSQQGAFHTGDSPDTFLREGTLSSGFVEGQSAM